MNPFLSSHMYKDHNYSTSPVTPKPLIPHPNWIISTVESYYYSLTILYLELDYLFVINDKNIAHMNTR